MAQKSGGAGSVSGVVKKIIIWTVVIGVLWAVLRQFDYDPFAVVEWVWNAFVSVITKIADFFSQSTWFQRIFSKPE